MSDSLNPHRRRLLQSTSALAALTVFNLSHATEVSTVLPNDLSRRTAGPTSIGTIRQINAGPLNVGYAEAGRSDGPVVILLHGWPHDIHSFAEVMPILADAGYRVIAPFLRGYGSTQIISQGTLRNGQQSVFAADLIALMDSLRVDRAILAGFDWGGRAANIVAAMWPNRCEALVSASGYLIGSQNANRKPASPQAELQAWFQYYFTTERGVQGYTNNRADFNKLIWRNASPQFHFDDATFLRTASSFDNPDHVAVVIHNYRWRLGLVQGEPQYDDLERKLAQAPKIAVPTITLEGDANGAPHQPPVAYASQFTGRYQHRDIKGGIGHNLPQEAPKEFAKAVIDVTRI